MSNGLASDPIGELRGLFREFDRDRRSTVIFDPDTSKHQDVKGKKIPLAMSTVHGPMLAPQTLEALTHLVNVLNEFDSALVFRGQAIDWPLHPSVVRRVVVASKKKHLFEQTSLENLVHASEDALLDGARLAGHGTGLSDLELLGALQHFGAATRLLDATKNLMVALWFAANDKNFEDETGVLFAFSPGKRLTAKQVRKKSLKKLLDLAARRGCYWAPPLEPRMLAQHAVLLLNVLEDKVDCSVPTTHFKFAVVPDLKKQVRTLFPRFGISERTLFPELPGFAASHGPGRSFDDDPDVQPYLSRHLEMLQGKRCVAVQNQMYAIQRKAKRRAQAEAETLHDHVTIPYSIENRIDREAIDRLRLKGFCEWTRDGLRVLKEKALEVVTPPEDT